MKSKDKPEYGKQYALTRNGPSIANGNTWAESVIEDPNPPTRTYRAAYKGKLMVLEAPSSFAGQRMAAKEFKAKKAYDVTVILANGEMPHPLY
jgi:hypothetical protein